jgi:hypothetical protein
MDEFEKNCQLILTMQIYDISMNFSESVGHENN